EREDRYRLRRGARGKEPQGTIPRDRRRKRRQEPPGESVQQQREGNRGAEQSGDDVAAVRLPRRLGIARPRMGMERGDSWTSNGHANCFIASEYELRGCSAMPSRRASPTGKRLTPTMAPATPASS